MIYQFLKLTLFCSISIAFVCFYSKGMKRAFESFTSTTEFPYDPFESIVNIMLIQVSVVVFAFFVGCPIVSFVPTNQFQVLLFLFVVMIVTSILRLINITGIGNNSNGGKQDSNRDIVTWCMISFGILTFITLTTPDTLMKSIHNFMIPTSLPLQFQTISETLVLGSFSITLITEFIGRGYKNIANRRPAKPNLTHTQ